MKVHAIQTGVVAVKTRQRRGHGHGLLRRLDTLRDTAWAPPLPILAWAIEHPDGVIVVDTGETARAAAPGHYYPRWHPYFRSGLRVSIRQEDEIGPRLAALGIRTVDVRLVVLTHLHTDHAGGLHHFPKADIVVGRTEYAAARGVAGMLRGYLPHRWPSWFAPRLVDFPREPLGPFPASMPLTRDGTVRAVPTPGHTTGHLSVVVEDGELLLVLAGDTSYAQDLMLEGAVDGVAPDEVAALETLARMRRLAETMPVVYLPSHDPASAQRLAARQAIVMPGAGPPGFC